MAKLVSIKSERGLYVVIAAIFAALALLLFALVVGVGMITTDKSRIQNIANIAALAALDEYMRDPSSVTYSARLDNALVRAQALIGANQLTGLKTPLAGLGHKNDPAATGGELEFGLWIPDAPVKDPCDPSGLTSLTCTTYPCFKPNPPKFGAGSPPGASCRANAARILLKTQPTNPIVAPFARLVGINSFDLSAGATATVVERCTALLLDVSGSVVSETHSEVPFNALNQQRIFAYQTNSAGFDRTCVTMPAAFSDGLIWCRGDTGAGASTRKGLQGTRPLGGLFGGDPALRYRSDYSATQVTRFGEFAIEKWVKAGYEGPQPLVTLLKAFNSGISALQAQSVGSDKISMIGMASNLVSPTPLYQMTDADFLLQVTNANNRGTFTFDNSDGSYDPEYAEIHPNFIDMGWFPKSFDSMTDIVTGLEAAMVQLNSCSATARKSIIIASDGLPSCEGSTCTLDATTKTPVCPASTCDDKSFAVYTEAEDNITGTGGVIDRLIAGRISASVILFGKNVEPNFLNIRKTDGTYLDQFESRALGYGGIGSATGKEYFNFSSDANSAADFADFIAGTSPSFTRVNGLMGALAFKTQGLWCPILPLFIDASCAGADKTCRYVDHDSDPNTPSKLGDAYRDDPSGTPSVQIHAIERLYIDDPLLTAAQNYQKALQVNDSLQAMKCFQDTLGGNPYHLVEE